MSAIQQVGDLPYSIETISRVFSKLNVPLQEKRLVSLFCKNCTLNVTCLQVFYRSKHTYPCPGCQRPLQRLSSKRIDLYYPKGHEFYDWHGRLTPVDSGSARKRLLPYLGAPRRSEPRFIQDQTSFSQIYHIVKRGDAITRECYCGSRRLSGNSHRIVSGLTVDIGADEICQGCVEEYDKYGSPRTKSSIKSKPHRTSEYTNALKLFVDKKVYGSVKLACELNGVSRTTFYRARDRFPDIYHQIFK